MANIVYADFTEKESEKIKKKWLKDIKTMIFLPLYMIIGSAVVIVVSVISSSHQQMVNYLYFYGGMSIFFIGLSLVLFITNNYRKDNAERKKIVLQACIKTHKYTLRTPFVKIPLATTLPFPVHDKVKKVKYRNTMMAKTTSFTDKPPSSFTFFLTNGIKYVIYENTFISATPGSFMELHFAKNSGMLLSYREIPSSQIETQNATSTIMESLYSEEDFMEEIEKMEKFFEKDTDADVIKPESDTGDFYEQNDIANSLNQINKTDDNDELFR